MAAYKLYWANCTRTTMRGKLCENDYAEETVRERLCGEVTQGDSVQTTRCKLRGGNCAGEIAWGICVLEVCIGQPTLQRCVYGVV